MSTISQTRKLLVVPNKSLTPAQYLCLVVLMESLRADKEQTDILAPQSLIDKYKDLASLPKSESIKIINKLEPKKFILNFKKGDSQVKHVQWNQTDSDISLYINMDKGAFKPEGMSFKTEGSDYDAILYYQIENFTDIAKLFEPYPNLVNEAKHISINKTLTIDHQKVEIIRNDLLTTLAELIYEQVKDTTNRGSLTKLVSSILLETDRFKKGIKDSHVFETLAKLVAQGADFNEANALTEKANKPAAETQGAPKPEGANTEGPKPAATPPNQPATNQPKDAQPQPANAAPRTDASNTPAQ